MKSPTSTAQGRLAGILAVVLFAQPCLPQTPQPPAQPQPRLVLKIFVLQGSDAVNSIPDRQVVTPVVEVRDTNDLPVEGADVVFELPQTGPGGTFANQQFQFKTRTNAQGQAAAPFQLGPTPGTFQIVVQATQADRVGRTVITQTNSMRPLEEATATKSRRRWYTNWKFLAIAGGAAAAAGIVLATRGGSSTPAGPGSITISPGNPTFGGPR